MFGGRSMMIGVDLGGTNIKAGAIFNSGKVLYKISKDTNPKRDKSQIIQDIIIIIEDIIKNTTNDINTIQSIGIGVPGVVQKGTGNILNCPNLNWHNVDLGDILKRHFMREIFIENDASLAGLAESVFGSTKGYKNSVFITLGTGIGAGIIIDGKIYSGSHGVGSEIGHMIVGENFYDCNCGRNGCLETFASATALIKYSQKRIDEGFIETELIHNYKDLDAKMIFDFAYKGDRLANEVLDRFYKYLTIGILSIYDILDPDAIAIGGGVSKAGDKLIERLKHEVSSRVFIKSIKYGEITLASLGNDAGIIGAAILGEIMKSH